MSEPTTTPAQIETSRVITASQARLGDWNVGAIAGNWVLLKQKIDVLHRDKVVGRVTDVYTAGGALYVTMRLHSPPPAGQKPMVPNVEVYRDYKGKGQAIRRVEMVPETRVQLIGGDDEEALVCNSPGCDNEPMAIACQNAGETSKGDRVCRFHGCAFCEDIEPVSPAPSAEKKTDELTERELGIAAEHLKALVPAFASKLAPIYELLVWQWGDHRDLSHKRMYVPDEAAIRRALDRQIDGLLDGVKDIRGCTKIGSNSGGLWVSVEKSDGGNLEYGMGFGVDEGGELSAWDLRDRP